MAHTLRSWLPPVALLSTWLAVGQSASYAKPPADKHPAAEDPYDAARDAESRLDYKAVIFYGNDALEKANTHERIVNLYALLGTAYAVLGRNDEAVDAFTRLLGVSPDYHLPRGLSPKVTRPFKEAGGYWLDRPGGLGVTPDLPREIAGGKPLSIAVKLDDPMTMVTNVRLSFRHQGDPEFDKLEMAAGPGVVFMIPAEKLPVAKADYAFELYVTALGSTGSELRQAGDGAHPLSILVRAPRDESVAVVVAPIVGGTTAPAQPKKPLIKQWWLWTAVGVVVVGAALGGGLGYYYSRDTSHIDLSLSSRTGP